MGRAPTDSTTKLPEFSKKCFFVLSLSCLHQKATILEFVQISCNFFHCRNSISFDIILNLSLHRTGKIVRASKKCLTVLLPTLYIENSVLAVVNTACLSSLRGRVLGFWTNCQILSLSNFYVLGIVPAGCNSHFPQMNKKKQGSDYWCHRYGFSSQDF